ncbi:response regulator transcription factor [Bacillus carboniphilus]
MVVDDHDLVRKGILSYLKTDDQFHIVGEAESGNKAIKLAESVQPDVILMDLMMEDGDGISATKQIIEKLPHVKIIILTSFYDDEKVFPAIEAGAFSYLLKTAKAEEVVDTVKKAFKGDPVIETKVAYKLLNRVRKSDPKPHDHLTERELEVLTCLGDGMTNQEISDELFIGIKTVKTHVSNILSKLGVQDRTQAAIYANRNGILRKSE